MEQMDRAISLAGLSRFVRAILRHRWLILGIVALAVAVVAVTSWLAPPVYQAESWLLIRTAAPTVTQPNPLPVDIDGMSTLVASPALEARVLASPQAGQLPKDLQHPGTLLHFIDVRAVQPGQSTSVIKIVASLPSPEDATALSSLWAAEAVTFLNEQFLGNMDALTSLQKDTKARYDAAEQRYQTFLGQSPIPGLQAQITAQEKTLGTYYATQSASEAAVYLQQLEANQQHLTDQYSLQQKLKTAIASAQSLKTTASSGNGSPLGESATLTSLLLATSGLVPPGTLPVQVQVAPAGGAAPTPSRAAEIQQLDSLLVVLQDRAQTVQTDIDSTSQQILATKTYSLTLPAQPGAAALLARDLDLNKQLEVATVSKQELESERDLLWTSYTELNKRAVDATGGLGALNRVQQVVTPDETLVARSTNKSQVLTRNVLMTLGVSLAGMVLLVLIYELFAPGKQILRELAGLRPRRRPAVSPQG